MPSAVAPSLYPHNSSNILASSSPPYPSMNMTPTGAVAGGAATAAAAMMGGSSAISSGATTSGAGYYGGGYQQQQQLSTRSGNTTTYNTGMQAERVESTRQVSSTIVHEEYVGALPQQEEVTYVEVPYYEEVVKHVPRKEIVEVEKRVPKYEYEWVERVVEIPQIQYVDRQVEIPQIQEVIRHVPKTQIVDVPTEVIRHVPKIETKLVEKMVEVPGQVIEVPKPYVVENKVPVTRYNDREVAMVVAQSVKPILTEGSGYIDVEVHEYEPECVPVDVHVIKPVSAHIVAGLAETTHKIVTVPAAQYNSILKSLNVHLNETEINKLPYLTESGRVPFLSDNRCIGAQPLAGAVIFDQFGNVRQTNTTFAVSSASARNSVAGIHQSSYMQQSAMETRGGGQITTTGYTTTTTSPAALGLSAAAIIPTSSSSYSTTNLESAALQQYSSKPTTSSIMLGSGGGYPIASRAY